MNKETRSRVDRVEKSKATDFLNIAQCWRKLQLWNSPVHRLNRMQYLGLICFWSIATFFLYIILACVSLVNIEYFNILNVFIWIIVVIFIFSNAVVVNIRRAHDMNLSAWWLLLFLIPFVGILLEIVLFVWPGTKNINRFGLQPIAASKRYYWMMLPMLLITSCSLFLISVMR